MVLGCFNSILSVKCELNGVFGGVVGCLVFGFCKLFFLAP